MSLKKSFANVKNELLAEQKQEIREAFQLFDMNHDGMLDYHEFKVALRALGFDASKKEVLELIHKFDTDDTHLISYDNFYLAGMYMLELTSASEPRSHVKKPREPIG